MSRKKKNAAQQRQTSRELIDIQKITEYGLLTSHGELVFFSIEPTNLSVHSPESIGSRIYALMTVLKGMAEIEMLALNSKGVLRIISDTTASFGSRSSFRSSANCWRET